MVREKTEKNELFILLEISNMDELFNIIDPDIVKDNLNGLIDQLNELLTKDSCKTEHINPNYLWITLPKELTQEDKKSQRRLLLLTAKIKSFLANELMGFKLRASMVSGTLDEGKGLKASCFRGSILKRAFELAKDTTEHGLTLDTALKSILAA